MTGSFAEIGHRDALDHHPFESNLGDADDPDGLAFWRRREGRRGGGRSRDGLAGLSCFDDGTVEVGAQIVLLLVLVQACSPELIRDEQEEEGPAGEQESTDEVDGPTHRGDGSG